MVERVEEGVWRVPDDLAERGLRYDRERPGDAEIRILSSYSLERQRQAIGDIWLDQQLIASAQPPANDVWAPEVASALRDREQRLIHQGLAA